MKKINPALIVLSVLVFIFIFSVIFVIKDSSSIKKIEGNITDIKKISCSNIDDVCTYEITADYKVKDKVYTKIFLKYTSEEYNDDKITIYYHKDNPDTAKLKRPSYRLFNICIGIDLVLIITCLLFYYHPAFKKK